MDVRRTGLSAADAAERLRRDGPDVVAVRRPVRLPYRVALQLRDPLILVLLGPVAIADPPREVLGSAAAGVPCYLLARTDRHRADVRHAREARPETRAGDRPGTRAGDTLETRR